MIRYVNFLLIQLFKAEMQIKVLYRNVELPLLTVESKTCKPPRLDEVVKRLKEMCDIEADVHSTPVEGTVSCTFQGASFKVKCHFDDSADACCWIRAEKSEDVRDCPALDDCHKNPIRTDGHRKIAYDSLQRQEPRKRMWIAGLVLLALLLVASVIWLAYCRRAESPLNALKTAGHSFREETAGPVWFRKFADKFNLPVPKRIVQFESRTATDEDLAIVAKERSIRTVFLHGAPVTDVGLAHIKGLPAIQVVYLGDMQITDAGLQHLGQLPELGVLGLSGTKVTDAGLRHLGRLPELWSLGLSGTEVTDAGLGHLRGLKRLQNLGLSDTAVTDQGLARLSGLASLTFLRLDRTQVTDEGLEHLSKMKQLTRVYLQGTRVTPEGVDRLRAAIPGLDVRTD